MSLNAQRKTVSFLLAGPLPKKNKSGATTVRGVRGEVPSAEWGGLDWEILYSVPPSHVQSADLGTAPARIGRRQAMAISRSSLFEKTGPTGYVPGEKAREENLGEK